MQTETCFGREIPTDIDAMSTKDLCTKLLWEYSEELIDLAMSKEDEDGHECMLLLIDTLLEKVDDEFQRPPMHAYRYTQPKG